jgi:hypothetical protein
LKPAEEWQGKLIGGGKDSKKVFIQLSSGYRGNPLLMRFFLGYSCIPTACWVISRREEIREIKKVKYLLRPIEETKNCQKRRRFSLPHPAFGHLLPA